MSTHTFLLMFHTNIDDFVATSCIWSEFEDMYSIHFFVALNCHFPPWKLRTRFLSKKKHKRPSQYLSQHNSNWKRTLLSWLCRCSFTLAVCSHKTVKASEQYLETELTTPCTSKIEVRGIPMSPVLQLHSVCSWLQYCLLKWYECSKSIHSFCK